MFSKINSARFFAACFILSFLTYGIGSLMVESMQLVQLNLNDKEMIRTKYILGIVLISVFHTIFNLCLLLTMNSVIRQLSPFLSKVYLYFGCVATVLLAIGGLCLLWPILKFGSELELNEFLSEMNHGHQMNFRLYQIGMCLWGFAGIALCWTFIQFKFFPLWFCCLGIVVYTVFIIGTILELNHVKVGVYFSIPGGLFELTLSVWLIIRGCIIKSPTASSFS
ncbi:MAG TPA: DUF4386 domain-containing protein [Bacteroidia bacterium]